MVDLREKLRAVIPQEDENLTSLNQNQEVEAALEHREVQGTQEEGISPSDGRPLNDEQDEVQPSTDLPAIIKTRKSFISWTNRGITLEEERRHLIWLHEHVAHGAQAEEASSQGESTEWEDDTTTHCSA
ncbi:hypothetical protein DM860_001068 [Cuscuta australis]|uniref:Uncharacterized protein n=1 Tax=Cuscuta australis TaxID=267555 RepID=A0A328DW83_9ASTE|nr:hypothetical protein DM860_001068 [Cuscuta australis]